MSFPVSRGPAGVFRASVIAVVLLLATAGIAVAVADDAVAALMHRLAARHGGTAHFVERQYLSLLKTPVESSGELYFEAPDHLEKRTLTPKPESVVIERGTLTFERGTRRRSVSLASFPQLGAFIESIRATLAGDRAALETLYRLELRDDGAGWALALTPRDEQLARLVKIVRIAGHDDLIDSMEILRVDGDRSVMTISAPTAAR
jgi:hypothetical protein